MTELRHLPGIRPQEAVVLASESIRRNPIRSLVTFAIVVLAAAAVAITTGRSDAARTELVARLDAPQARVIRIVDRTGGAEMKADALMRVQALSSVDWAIALGRVGELGRNAGLLESAGAGNGGEPIGIRRFWGSLDESPLAALEMGRPARGNEVIVGSRAFESLGLTTSAGTIAGERQELVGIVGKMRFVDPIDDLNSYALVRGTDRATGTVSEFVVLAASSSAVETLVDLLPSVIAPQDVSALGIERAAELVRIRDELALQVNELNAAVLIASLSGSAALLMVNLFGAIAERRREFGLRRTQGATRSTIAALVLLEVTALAAAGALAGVTAGTVMIAWQTGLVLDPLLGAAIAALLLVAGVVGALPPALAAAYREPLYALR